MSLKDVNKRVSEVGGDQASGGWQRAVGYIAVLTTAILWHRPAKHREQGSGLFHSSGRLKTSQSGGGSLTSRQDEVRPSPTSVTARRLANSPA
jgi:hypothetical protein